LRGDLRVRFIGNKTKLLNFIGDFLTEMGIEEGRALDAFAGTASVGSYFKSRGFEVDSCDVLTASYVFQKAYIVSNEYPPFDGLTDDAYFAEARADPVFRQRVESRFKGQGHLFDPVPSGARALEEVLVYLDTVLPPAASFITEQYSASPNRSDNTRMYFTEENGRRIDAARIQLHEWQRAELISENEFYLLLASLLEAADSVANTTGVYAAFVKSWQSNALRPLSLRLPHVVTAKNLDCRAYQGDINRLIGSLRHYDLLYLDPPYNTRQYSAYYHVPEIIAEGWFEEIPVLRGKTGLVRDEHKKSAWSTRDGCVPALEYLLQHADATHVLLSYNDEGIIPEDEIERVFRSAGVFETYRRVGRDHKRYRSDMDSEVRRYSGDSVTEYLYYVRLR
jgi:adenine-specific DNA-methyltransferase